jgi:transposase
VLDVQPRLAARVRLLAAGDVNKNDPDDARSVAVAALRSAACLPVRADDHAAVLKVWAKRYRDLSRARNQAARILEAAGPRGAAGAARWVLAAQLLAGLRRIDIQRRDVQPKLAAAVRASGTAATEIFGVGPAVAAAVIGDAGDISRFASQDHFAAYNGTAPVGVSFGGRVICRLSLRGNRRMNHAIHMAAVTQIRCRHSKGRAYYDKKIAEGKTSKEALRALKRQVSNAIYQRLKGRRAPCRCGSGRAPGERLRSQRGRLTPRTPALRPSHSRTWPHPTAAARPRQDRAS